MPQQQGTGGLGGIISGALKGRVSQTASNLVELAAIVTDYEKSAKNENLMATIKLPYYTGKMDSQGAVIDAGAVSNVPAKLKGFMVNGFGWDISNEYEALLDNTSAQKEINKMMQGGSELSSMFSGNIIHEDSLALAGANKITMSLQQTMAVWVGMKKPSFSITLLFFDAEGNDTTDVTKVAYIIERGMTPYVNEAGVGGYNMFMQAPGGYRALARNFNNRGQLNRTYNLSAENTIELTVGNYLFFPELICTGVGLRYSDKILATGKPQWLEAQFSFSMWRQQVLEDIDVRYR